MDIKECDVVNFENSTLEVADPSTKHQPVVIENCLPGRWQPVILRETMDKFGTWNIALQIAHEDHQLCSDCIKWDEVGEIWIDTGEAAIYEPDPDNYSDWRVKGASCQSGLGDGVYPVFISRNEDGKVISIRVEFFPESDECEHTDEAAKAP